ncbi:MAG: hypothetical protein IJQ03_00075, partial [Firmicutes bacterium]|nr:hypothetical protein [Bacillota bacterium]
MTTLDNANSEQIRSYLSLENDFTAAAHSAAEALAKAKEQLGDIEERAEQSEEGAYAARAAANDLISDYQTAADSVSLLTAEEADRSRSAELMQSLVQETLGYPEATDEHLSELMERARQELLSCSSQAEEELQSKRQALSEAREKERLLQIDSGAMQLSACVEQLRQLVSQDELALCRHEIEQQDLRQRLNEGRARIAGNLSSIIEKRAGLGEAIDSYRSKTETIQQLEADEARHDQIIEKLTADMKQIGADIIPHSQSICKLETEVSSLRRELDSVSADEDRSAALRQELEQQLSGRRDELERLNREAGEETEHLARETEQRVTAARQQKDEAESLLEQIKTKLESDRQSFRKAQEELPYAEATKAELEQSLAQARKSAADTERMINSAASARQGMQSGSGGVLNNLESVLKKTLDSTRGLVSKLEGDLSEAAASLTEKQDSFRLFSQQVNEGSQRHDQLEQQARDAAARYEQAVSETAAASEEAKARHSRLLNAAESALTETEERFRAADAELSKHSGNREQLSARLSDLTQQLDQTKEEYGEVRRRVTQLNEEIEAEVIQKTSDLDQKLLDYWEESKTNLR